MGEWWCASSLMGAMVWGCEGFTGLGWMGVPEGRKRGLNGVYMEVFESLLRRGCGESCAFYFGRLGELLGCEYFHIVTIW